MPSFAEFVAQGLASGLTRAEAERQARDALFEQSEKDDEKEGAFPSVDALWAHLVAAWNKRNDGVELADVLEEINSLLERGVISQEQFET
eukprot:4228835-Prymnesium_polylepis.1